MATPLSAVRLIVTESLNDAHASLGHDAHGAPEHAQHGKHDDNNNNLDTHYEMLSSLTGEPTSATTSPVVDAAPNTGFSWIAEDIPASGVTDSCGST